MRRRVLLPDELVSVSSAVAAVLLVVITVSMVGVVGSFVFGIVKLPEEAPQMKVVYTHLNNRWSIHFDEVSEEAEISEFRLISTQPDGDFVTYDPDGDGTADSLLVTDLDELVVPSGGGPQNAPVVYIDIDGDGKVSTGDQMVAYSIYMPASSLFLDGTRGFKKVGMAPHGIPLDSDLFILMTADTLATSNLMPGDEVVLVIKHGSTVEATRNGNVPASGALVSTVHLEPTWHLGNHKAQFTVRPGEIDEWYVQEMFKALNPDPPTPEEMEQYEQLTKPMQRGDLIRLVHKPSNQVVLEFEL